MQEIPEYNCAGKETVYIDIQECNMQEWWQKDSAIYQNNEQISLEKKELLVKLVLTNIYQSNTYREDLNWLDFDNEPRVQEKQQVNDQQFCVFIFAACVTISSSNQRHQPRLDNIIPYMDVWQIYRDIEQPRGKETSQNKLKLQFSWRYIQQQR